MLRPSLKLLLRVAVDADTSSSCIADTNASLRVTRAQLAVYKPAPFEFSLPLDLCLLDLGLCGPALKGPKPQPSPAPFLLPNFAPQVRHGPAFACCLEQLGMPRLTK